VHLDIASEGSLSMPKALCISGSVVAVLMLLVFGLDLAIAVPFGRASMAMDVAALVSAAMLAVLSWTTLKEQR
jgi:hypothetical protein